MVGIVEGPINRFRCHTGHAFTQRALAHQRASEIEKTLWSALAQLEEFQMLLGEISAPEAESQLETRRTQLRQLINEVRSTFVASAQLQRP